MVHDAERSALSPPTLDPFGNIFVKKNLKSYKFEGSLTKRTGACTALPDVRC